MKQTHKNILIIVIGILIVAGGIWGLVAYQNKPDQLDGFASCLKDKGLKFYGAFWCPHCQNQKKEFGRSDRLLPYIECSTPAGNAQLPVCTEAKIESYPTWEFPDGTRELGELSLSRLAEKSGCELPVTP